MDVQELRIHGVSGTPPEAMLGLQAVALDRAGRPGYGPDGVQVFTEPRRAHADAFSWGGLTSGSWRKALWLVLLPFVLVNAAGWTLAPTRPDGSSPLDRFRVATLRLASIVATALSAQLIFVVVVDIVAWQWARVQLGDVLGLDAAAFWPRLGTLVVLAIIAALWERNRIRAPGTSSLGTYEATDPTTYGDPTLRCRLDDPTEPLWSHAGLIQRLRTLHGSAALGAVTFSVGLMGSGAHLDLPVGHDLDIDPWLAWPGLALVVASGLLAVWRSLALEAEPAPFGAATRALGWASIAAAVLAVVRIAPRSQPAFGSLRDSSTVAGALFAVLILGVLLVAEVVARRTGPGRPRRAAATAPAMGMLGLATIGAAGSAGEMLAGLWLGGGRDCLERSAQCTVRIGNGAYSLAVTYAALLLLVLGAAAIWFAAVARARRADPDAAGEDCGSPDMLTLRRLLTEPAIAMAWLVGVAIAVMLLSLTLWAVDGAVARSIRDAHPPWFLVVIAWAVPVVVALWVLAVTLPTRVRVGVLLVVAAAAWAAQAVTLPETRVVGLYVNLDSPLHLVMWLGLLGPVIAIALKAWSGIRSPADRRHLGILWDLGLFWPRWFHPFTPPTYSDQAVRTFRAEIRDRLAEGPVIVSSHSQGTFIAVATLAIMRDDELARIGLITYGSPVGRLYGELFGPQVDAPFVAGVRQRLTDASGAVRWRNLHRVTDPIGGPIVAAHQDWMGDAADWTATEQAGGLALGGMCDTEAYRAHSGYQFTAEYAAAVTELTTLLADG